MQRFLLMAGAIFIVATAALWLGLMPDDPDLAVIDSTAAALVASNALLDKLERDQRRR